MQKAYLERVAHYSDETFVLWGSLRRAVFELLWTSTALGRMGRGLRGWSL